MTIEKGAAWGRDVPRPPELLVVADDRALVDALTGTNRVPVALSGGDLAQTLGASGPGRRERLNEFPIDLIEVRLDDATEAFISCAHVVARSPWWRGSWWRGPVLVAMNAEFYGASDVAPRGHPNDGRVETFLVDATMSVRQRLVARRRLATGAHVPHPAIATRSVRTSRWTFSQPLDVFVDRQRVGRASTIEVTVEPDAAIVLA